MIAEIARPVRDATRTGMAAIGRGREAPVPAMARVAPPRDQTAAGPAGTRTDPVVMTVGTPVGTGRGAGGTTVDNKAAPAAAGTGAPLATTGPAGRVDVSVPKTADRAVTRTVNGEAPTVGIARSVRVVTSRTATRHVDPGRATVARVRGARPIAVSVAKTAGTPEGRGSVAMSATRAPGHPVMTVAAFGREARRAAVGRTARSGVTAGNLPDRIETVGADRTGRAAGTAVLVVTIAATGPGGTTPASGGIPAAGPTGPPRAGTATRRAAMTLALIAPDTATARNEGMAPIEAAIGRARTAPRDPDRIGPTEAATVPILIGDRVPGPIGPIGVATGGRSAVTVTG